MAQPIDIYINEDFSGVTGSALPVGWTDDLIAGDRAIDQWRSDNPGDRPIPTPLGSPVAVFDSDFLSNDDVAENIALVSPVFNASSESQLFLQFDQNYVGLIDPVYGSKAYVEVYNGTTWNPVLTEVDDFKGTTRLDISQYAAGAANAQVRFRYEGNWSQYWQIDNVKVVDTLTPGITVSGVPLVSEDNVPDTRRFQFVLDSKPTANVTIRFKGDRNQLRSIRSLTFTPDNWNIAQIAKVSAVKDGIAEGEDQKSTIKIKVSSADPNYSNFSVPDAIATITDSTIPDFPSYRTVEATYRDVAQLAQNNPTLARWKKIGESYDKITPGGAPGYDLRALELTNRNVKPKGGKSVLYVEAGIHAREYSTNEVATRFAEYLTSRYGIDPEVTWLLDYNKIVVNPVVNPDGRKFAEQGYLWRKNTNPNPPAGSDPASFPNYGVDLNRNHGFKWGEVPEGSSNDPSSEVYRGDSPASEPETKAVENYVKTLFPDQRGLNQDDPAPEDATGVFLDLHSFGNTVLYPWGSTSELSPNRDALRNLGLKFGYYTNANGTPYDIYQSIGLYPADGTTDDWAYGTLGVAAYTWELGSTFLEPSDYFEQSIATQVNAALLYAAKAARRPYLTSSAPESVNVGLDLPQVVRDTSAVILTAKANTTRYADSNADGLEEGVELPKPINVKAARYSIDAPSWISGTQTYTLKAADGEFDSPSERLIARIDTSSLSIGRHTIFVESKSADRVWGVPTAVFLDVLRAPANAQVFNGKNTNETISATDNPDVIYGRDGNDTLSPQLGNDITIAGAGDDGVQDTDGNDLIYGGAGNDSLDGGVGNDKIYGEDGRDRLLGNNGNDLLWGGKDNDELTGGQGRDTFVLAAGEGSDTVLDFNRGQDKIGLAGTLAFNQLAIAQGTGGAIIKFGVEVLAQINGINASSLTANQFVSVPV